MYDCKATVVLDDETNNKSGDMVLALTEKSSVDRTIRAKSKKKKNLRGKAARASDKAPASTYAGGFMLTRNDAIGINRDDWILDSDASRHLVNDESLLIGSTACVHEIAMADGESLQLTCIKNMRLEVFALDMKIDVTLTEVCLAPRLTKNIVLYGKLEIKGFALVYDSNKRALARCSDGTFVFDVAINSSVLYVETTATRGRHNAEDAIMDSLEARAMDADAEGVHESSLLFGTSDLAT